MLTSNIVSFEKPGSGVLLQDALAVMGFIAVVVNTALIGVSGQIQKSSPDLDSTSVFIIIVIVEVRWYMNKGTNI